MEEKTACSTNGALKAGYPHVEKIKLGLFFSPCTKINLKCIKDFNVRTETLKMLEKNIDITLKNTDINKDLPKGIPVAQD